MWGYCRRCSRTLCGGTAGGTHVLARLGGDADRRGDLIAHRRQRAQPSTTLSATLNHGTVQHATCKSQHATDNMQHAAGKPVRPPTEMTVRSIVCLFVCLHRCFAAFASFGRPCVYFSKLRVRLAHFRRLFVCLLVWFACGAALRGDPRARVAAGQRRRRVVAASDAQCAAMQRPQPFNAAAMQRDVLQRATCATRSVAAMPLTAQRAAHAAHDGRRSSRVPDCAYA
jgi:hypothetical protein